MAKWKTRNDPDQAGYGKHYQEDETIIGARTRGSGMDMPAQTRSVSSMKSPASLYVFSREPTEKDADDIARFLRGIGRTARVKPEIDLGTNHPTGWYLVLTERERSNPSPGSTPYPSPASPEKLKIKIVNKCATGQKCSPTTPCLPNGFIGMNPAAARAHGIRSPKDTILILKDLDDNERTETIFHERREYAEMTHANAHTYRGAHAIALHEQKEKFGVGL
jgi:hypothetical protein